MNLKNLNYSPVLETESKNAVQSLNVTKFPHRNQEKWKYSKLSRLKKTSFHNHVNMVDLVSASHIITII